MNEQERKTLEDNRTLFVKVVGIDTDGNRMVLDAFEDGDDADKYIEALHKNIHAVSKYISFYTYTDHFYNRGVDVKQLADFHYPQL